MASRPNIEKNSAEGLVTGYGMTLKVSKLNTKSIIILLAAV